MIARVKVRRPHHYKCAAVMLTLAAACVTVESHAGSRSDILPACKFFHSSLKEAERAAPANTRVISGTISEIFLSPPRNPVKPYLFAIRFQVVSSQHPDIVIGELRSANAWTTPCSRHVDNEEQLRLGEWFFAIGVSGPEYGLIIGIPKP
jgi:hypothetical protein